MIKKGIEYILSLAYCLFLKINWVRFFKLKNKKADNVIWLYQNYPTGFIKYVLGGCLVYDMSVVYSFIKQNKSFALVFGKLPQYATPKKIFYTVSHRFNLNNETDYTKPLIAKVAALENAGHILYPSAAEAKYWENKIYMHQQFEEQHINQPKTTFVSNDINYSANEDDYVFPLLIKEAHSCHTQGIYKVNSYAELTTKIAECRSNHVNDFLLQNLVNMRKDMRVIFTGDEIVLYYWRINLKSEWKPTSTSHGSMVDFDFFPEKWRSTLIDYFNRLKLTTGAFDVTFENDDTNTPPIILEVSPSYMPNPKPTGKQATIPYYEYKKKLFIKNVYYKAMIDIVYDLKNKEIAVVMGRG